MNDKGLLGHVRVRPRHYVRGGSYMTVCDMTSLGWTAGYGSGSRTEQGAGTDSSVQDSGLT